ncbi:histidine phosphatase family protein [Granulosicoccaceae sp. 1_MG-2023]|nr:histidine phosphatase family protein [Granulosicoccaceae sp. 1_MG-2023]
MGDGGDFFVDLLRHGEAAGGSVFRGTRDDPLTAQGLADMRAVSAALQGIDRVFSSPRQRCLAFAEEFAAAQGCTLDTLAAFGEYDFGDWEGRAVAQVYREQRGALERFWQDPLQHPPPGGEPFAAFCARVEQGWETFLQRNQNHHALIVTHGGPIRVLLCQLLGWPLSSMNALEVAHASHTRLRISPAADRLYCSLVFFNRSPVMP